MMLNASSASQSRISPNHVPPVNPGGPNLIRANLVALWVETVLYGVFLVLFIASLYIFLYVKRGKNVYINRVLAVASVTMLLLITGVSPRWLDARTCRIIN